MEVGHPPPRKKKNPIFNQARTLEVQQIFGVNKFVGGQIIWVCQKKKLGGAKCWAKTIFGVTNILGQMFGGVKNVKKSNF